MKHPILPLAKIYFSMYIKRYSDTNVIFATVIQNFLSGKDAYWSSQVASVVKKSPANARDIREEILIPESGRSPEGGHDNTC